MGANPSQLNGSWHSTKRSDLDMDPSAWAGNNGSCGLPLVYNIFAKRNQEKPTPAALFQETVKATGSKASLPAAASWALARPATNLSSP